MIKKLFKKTLVFAIVVLFVGASITSIVSANIKQVKNNEVLKILNNKLKEIVIIVDQAVDSQCGDMQGGYQIKKHMPFGQSFKPLYTCHYGIELYIENLNPNHPLAPIQISLKENNISGPIVPGANVTLNLTSGDGWRFFEFASPINLTIDQTYVIDISTTTIRWGVWVTRGFCYTRGLCYLLGAPDSLMDLFFRTYVLIKPPYAPTINGPHHVKPKIEYDYIFNTTDPDGDPIMYYVDWGDNITEWTKYSDSGEEITLKHIWNEIGNYTIKAKAEDIHGAESNWSDPFKVVIENNPPENPQIDGPNRGKPYMEYTYTFVTEDLDGDLVYYYTDWNDGNVEEWIGPFPSDELIIVNHTWSEHGIYIIRAKAKDICDAESGWSEFEVNIPRTRATFNSLFLWFLERFPLLEKLLNLLG